MEVACQGQVTFFNGKKAFKEEGIWKNKKKYTRQAG